MRASDRFLAPLQGAVVIVLRFPGVALVPLAYPWLFSLHASGVRDSRFEALRSFHSLTPGYLPCTPPACETAVSKHSA